MEEILDKKEQNVKPASLPANVYAKVIIGNVTYKLRGTLLEIVSFVSELKEMKQQILTDGFDKKRGSLCHK